MSTQQIIVIKVGTDVLKNVLAFSIIARQIAELKKMGYGVILVTSGGVIAGSDYVTFLGGNPKQYHKCILASIGASSLLEHWGKALMLDRLVPAQCYFTYGNLRFKGEKESIRSRLRLLAFDQFAVPLVNENDIVSGVEIEKMKKGLGDNDRLARIVSCLVQAGHVLFATEKGAVYTDNPDKNKNAERVARIDAKKGFRLPGQTSGPSKNGSGGMQSKINQAAICARKGMHSGIIGLHDPVRFMNGEDVGTLVCM